MGNTVWILWRKYPWAQSIISYFIVFPLVTVLIWIFGYVCFGELVFPGGSLFALGLLELIAVILGHVFESIELPPLLGMLAAGLLVRNVPHLDFAKDLDPTVIGLLRGTSVVVLLTRGALTVNPTVISKFRWVIPQLAVGACVTEAAVGTLVSYYILGFPIQWAAAMGCIFSGMSQAATTPYLNHLEKDGLGVSNDWIKIAKFGCGLDAILGISMTECAFGFIFANGDLSDGLMKGIVEVIMGLGLAIVWGTLAGIFLDENHGSVLRTFVLFAGGVISLPGLTRIGYPRGGPPACFFGALIASSFWRNKAIDGENNDQVNINFLKLWYIFQPLLFGIIGSKTDITMIDWALMSQGMLCLISSITGRLIAVFSLLCFSELTIREKFAMSFSWVTKGTVQAALGPVALETAVAGQLDNSMILMGNKIMNLAVLVIILASATGAFLLLIVVPKLLKGS